MRTVPKILYFLCFVGLATTAALTLNGMVTPSMSESLFRAVLAAAAAGAPGLIHRRLWPLGVVLLPLAAYFLLRTTIPVPATVEGIAGQYHFYAQTLRDGAHAYLSGFFPFKLGDQSDLQLLIAFCVFWLVGVSSFVGLILRRAVPAIAIMLVLIGFSFTVDTIAPALWA